MYVGRTSTGVCPLSEAQVMHHQLEIVRDGFTVIPSAVPPQYLHAALQSINKEFGKLVTGTARTPDGDSAAASSVRNGQQLDIATCPAFDQLYNASGLQGMASEIIGRPLKPNGWGQVACRFPGDHCLPVPPSVEAGEVYPYVPAPWWCEGWHIDGLPGATNKNHPVGALGHFAALIGVCLEDATDEMMGNLIVYPQSHTLVNRYLREEGALSAVEQRGIDGMPKDLVLSFRPPVQVRMRAGDVVMAHYLLAHSIAPNAGHRIRYQVYYRVQVSDHPPLPSPSASPYRKEAVLNLWEDFGDTVKAISMSLPPSPPYVSQADHERNVQQKAAAEAAYTAQDWGAAAPLFERLANAYPLNYLFHFKAGSAYTWSAWQFLGKLRVPEANRQAQQGLTHLDRAIQVYKGVMGPHSYIFCIMARNLAIQQRYTEAIAVITTRVLSSPFMLQTPMGCWYNVAEQPWQKDLIIRTARLLGECLQKTGRMEEIEAMRRLFAKQFPNVPEATQTVGGGPQGCMIA